MGLLPLIKRLALAALGLLTVVFPFLPLRAHGAPFSGSVPAHVLRVIDGDTVAVEAQIWIDQRIDVDVRLLGIDAPEIGSHAHCDEERAKAEAAKQYLASLIEGEDVMLADLSNDKYGGRIDARILIGGRDVSNLMLAKGLAMSYDGGRKKPWCLTAAG